MIIKPLNIKRCSSCGNEIKEYDNEINVDYQGFLHCDNCLIHCLKERPD